MTRIEQEISSSPNKGMVSDYLVVDSGGFLRNAPLRSLGNHIITLDDVISEIKDKATKERLEVLPYQLLIEEPSSEAIQKVSEFAKKSGDFSTLSVTDLKVLALTYDLEKDKVGSVDHLKTEPTINKTTNFYKPGQNNNNENGNSTSNTKMAGFYDGSKDDEEDENDNKDDKEDTKNKLSERVDQLTSKDEKTHRDKVEISISKDKSEESDENVVGLTSDSFGDNGTEEEDLEISEEEDEDEEGWITPSNVKDKKREMMGLNDNDKPQFVTVACMTTDFAMQNVLKQMGLNVVSVDGLLIHQTKTWILRCYSCFKTTHLMHKQFCPKCGNKTLKRVSVTVDDEGNQQIHISTRKKLTGRGKKFSLPKPMGGKHAVNPILCEDQNFAQQRRTKMAQQTTNAMHPDYIAGNSPFSLHDVTSKSAIMGTPGVGVMNNMYWMKKNPNSSGKSSGNRKKKNRK